MCIRDSFGIYSNITVTNSSGCTSLFDDVFEMEKCVLIPKGISPNNDGLNDRFDVSKLNASRITIYDRHGRKVYELQNYRNEWEGTTNDGDKLPTGVYFYVIEVSSENKPISGWVYLNKDAR